MHDKQSLALKQRRIIVRTATGINRTLDTLFSAEYQVTVKGIFHCRRVCEYVWVRTGRRGGETGVEDEFMQSV